MFISPLPSFIFVYSMRWCTGVAPVLKSEPWHCLGDHKGCKESTGLHPKWLPVRQVLDLLVISRSCHNAALPELLHPFLAVALAPLSCIVCVWGYSPGVMGSKASLCGSLACFPIQVVALTQLSCTPLLWQVPMRGWVRCEMVCRAEGHCRDVRMLVGPWGCTSH